MEIPMGDPTLVDDGWLVTTAKLPEKPIPANKFCKECLEGYLENVSKRCPTCHHYVNLHKCPFARIHKCPSSFCHSLDTCPTNATQSHKKRVQKKRAGEPLVDGCRGEDEVKKVKLCDEEDEEEIIAHIRALESELAEHKKKLAFIRFSRLSEDKVLELSKF
jgi:hypothetical protein